MLSFKTIASRAAAPLAAAMLSFAAAGCGKPPPAGLVTVLPPACEVLPAPLTAPDTVTVALFERVVPLYAPWGRNTAEDLVFRQIYETLITRDCEGRIKTGLAGSWKSEDEGRRWAFELRDGARFSDGSPVRAADVVNSWADALMLDTEIDSVGVNGDRKVLVHFREPLRDMPLVLCAPVFSVAKKIEGELWPLGSGPYEIDSLERIAAQTRTGLVAGPVVPLSPTRRAAKPLIRFVSASAGDARDLLEGPFDLMITADPNVIEYASGDPRFVAAPLDWEKTYVLLSTSRVREISAGNPPPLLPPDVLGVLSRDAVRGDTRGSREPAWWEGGRACRVFAEAGGATRNPVSTGPPPGSRRILFDSGDPTARDLAERLVALASAEPLRSPETAALASAIPGLVGGLPGVVAHGVDRYQLERSLRAGNETAYVVSLPIRPALPCVEIGRFFDRVPWIAALGPAFSTALVPLVDARSSAIARRDRLGIDRDWYGIRLTTDETREGD